MAGFPSQDPVSRDGKRILTFLGGVDQVNRFRLMIFVA
jgi:hypothetical protein